MLVSVSFPEVPAGPCSEPRVHDETSDLSSTGPFILTDERTLWLIDNCPSGQTHPSYIVSSPKVLPSCVSSNVELELAQRRNTTDHGTSTYPWVERGGKVAL